MIIQALPGSGKSHLARLRGDVVDSDDLLRDIFGVKGKAGYESLLSDLHDRERLRDTIHTLDRGGAVVLCNFDPSDVFARVDARFSYTPLGYVRHLRLVGRLDLLMRFEEDELTSWASSYLGKRHVQWLNPGQFLSEFI